MSMPFYVSPEQLMKDRADYARKGIARGRSVVVLQYDDGIAFATENASRALHKICEIYDRIGFAAVGKYNEFENLRVAGVRYADLRGYSYDRVDVTARGLANAYAQTLGTVFTTESKPLEVELVVAEVGREARATRSTGWPTTAPSPTSTASSSWAARPNSSARSSRGLARRHDPCGGARAGRRTLGSPAEDGGEQRAIPAAQLEVAVLDRTRRAGRSVGWRVPCWRTARGADRRRPTCAHDERTTRRSDGAWTAGSSGSRPSSASPAPPRTGAGCRPTRWRGTCSARSSRGAARNVFLSNGARLYLDVGSHPEYATPECDDVRQLVIHDRAGERILEGLVADAAAAARARGPRRGSLPLQEQHRLRGQLLRLPRELPRAAAGRLLAAVRRAHAVPRHAADPRGRGQGPADPPGRRSTASRSAPTTSGRPSAARRRGPGRSSTRATSRTPMPSATVACT